MKGKGAWIFLVIVLILSLGFTAGAEEKKENMKVFGRVSPLPTPQRPEGTMQAAGEFYWDNAVLDDADGVVDCRTPSILYWISLHNVPVGDGFEWRYYHPVKDPRTGLPTSAYEIYCCFNAAWSRYDSNYWFYIGAPWYYFYYYYPSDSGSFGSGVYINGTDAAAHPGVWKVEIWRSHQDPVTLEYNQTFLTSTAFTINDICPPSVVFNHPFEDAALAGREKVQITASDTASTVTGLELWAENTAGGQKYDLGILTRHSDAFAYDYTWDTGKYPLGKYTLHAKATDAYGNEAETQRNVILAKVGVIEMSAINSVPLPNVENPVFTGHFDANGNVVTDVTKPIGEFLNDEFELFVVVDGYPQKPAWAPKVEWTWSIQGMGSGSGSFEDWTGTIPIKPTVDLSHISDRTFKDKEIKLDFKYYRRTIPPFAPVTTAKGKNGRPGPAAPGGGGIYDPLGGGDANLKFVPKMLEITKIVVDDGPTIENPKEAPEKNEFSFVATSPWGPTKSINFEATTGYDDWDAMIKWQIVCTVAGNNTIGGDRTLPAADGPIGRYSLAPPYAPPGREMPLEYTVTASVQPTERMKVYSYQVIIKQNNVSDLRQEYVDVILNVLPVTGRVPAEGEFDQVTPDYTRLLDFEHNDIDRRHKSWIVNFINGRANAVDAVYAGDLAVTSGYRCPSRNAAIPGAVVNSNHQYGRAFDFNQGNSQENFNVFQIAIRDTNNGRAWDDSYLTGSDGTRYSWRLPQLPSPNVVTYIKGHVAWP